MNTTPHLVTVVCPTRNGALHLRDTIDSVLEQDYRPIELIVVDGGSDDESLEILESYGERLRYISEPDSGQSEAINKGFAMATGEYFAWLNSDDVYLPGAIRAAVDAFAETKADIVYGDALAEDGWGRRYGHRMNVDTGTSKTLVNDRCFIVQPASFWRRDVWETVGPLREDLHYALDYEFFMRATAAFEIAYWPYTFARERLHSGAKTFRGARNRIDEIREAAISNGGKDLPKSFQPEGAAVYTVDALRLASRLDFNEARKALRQAKVWVQPIEKYFVFLAVTLVAGGRGLPRIRLVSNYVIGRIQDVSAPRHNNPPIAHYRIRRPRGVRPLDPRLRSRVVRRTKGKLVEVSHRAKNRSASLIQRARGATQQLSTPAAVHRLKPRLGQLRQHEPRPLQVSAPELPREPLALPTMTVVTPSFNQGPFLGATIDSVLSQQYPDMEYIVQDGGSTDESVSILEGIQHDSLRWESKPDGGQSAAINLGHSKGSGEIMAWLNSDDILLPGTLHYVGAYFAMNPEVDAVYSHRVIIDAQGDEIGRWLVPQHDSKALTWADYIPQETLFWRRSLWDKVGGIDESFRFAMDWDLLVRFEEAGANTVRLPIFGGAFRVYDEQLTSSAIESLGAKEMDRIRRRCHGRNVESFEIAKALAPYMAKSVALDRAWRAGILGY